jgi:hypothetical protein
MFMLHAASAQGIRAHTLKCKIVSFDRSKDFGTETSATQGIGWSFSLAQLLAYADEGLTLDSPNVGNGPPDYLFAPPRDGATHPTVALRFTGFILTVHFTYWNFASISGDLMQYWNLFNPAEPQCDMRVELTPQAWGYAGASIEGSDSDLVFKNVARLRLVGTGSFGRISSKQLMLVFIEAVVLLAAANSVASVVAEKMFGYEFTHALTPESKSAFREQKPTVPSLSNGDPTLDTLRMPSTPNAKPEVVISD